MFVITGIFRTRIFRALAHAADAQGEDKVYRRAGLSMRMPFRPRVSHTRAITQHELLKSQICCKALEPTAHLGATNRREIEKITDC